MKLIFRMAFVLLCRRGPCRPGATFSEVVPLFVNVAINTTRVSSHNSLASAPLRMILPARFGPRKTNGGIYDTSVIFPVMYRARGPRILGVVQVASPA